MGSISFSISDIISLSLSVSLQSLEATSSTIPDIEIGTLNRILDGFRAEWIVLVQSEWTRFDEDRLKRLPKYGKIGNSGQSLSCFHANGETCARKISTRSRVKDSPALTSTVLRSNEPLCGWRFKEYMYAYVDVHAHIDSRLRTRW